MSRGNSVLAQSDGQSDTGESGLIFRQRVTDAGGDNRTELVGGSDYPFSFSEQL